MIANYVLMMFYTTVSAWMLQYFFKTAKGDFVGADAAKVSQIFSDVKCEPVTQIIFMGIIVAMGFFVCAIGLQNGLEKITKVMMLTLLMLIVVLAINSITLDGAKEGLKFYLVPNIDTMKKVGMVKIMVSAMNQAFFTLSLGMGSMAIFGSYLSKERALMGEAVNVAVLDTFVAFAAGLIIFPACSSFGVSVAKGHALIFETLPLTFENLPMGRFWGSLFFVFMSFAAFSTVFAVFENIMSCTRDLTGWGRKKTAIVNGITIFVLSLPCILGFNALKNFHPLGGGTNIMDLEDFLVSNICLPIGSLIFVLFCVNKRYGWGFESFMEEANTGKGLKVKKWMKGYMTYVLPIIIVVIFIVGLVDYFK